MPVLDPLAPPGGAEMKNVENLMFFVEKQRVFFACSAYFFLEKGSDVGYSGDVRSQ